MAQQEKFRFNHTFQGIEFANGIYSFYYIFHIVFYFRKLFYTPCVNPSSIAWTCNSKLVESDSIFVKDYIWVLAMRRRSSYWQPICEHSLSMIARLTRSDANTLSSVLKSCWRS